ncbi:energy-coupling factor ABC transporter ATP-binding protein [Vibrio sp. 10N.222.51.C12]|uniref:energy-coupling factor ABC transporter ATP-binding protein n=1 Tax=unclassified Vibrio TaxID=2614977 RepID=UPI000C864079|nr:energy-coupling factor ABC transporter ATP-binding protein [Vibrio sp. 10N.286.48.B7]PMH77719.1 energy-coupling factor ABC transporter ATP-binding protein [Vibrio sp. 10N.286.48.B7]
MDSLIELNNIYYQRSSGQICANELNFNLNPGDKVSITGSNGTGKSTLFQVMLGLLEGVSGKVRLFGDECHSEKDFVRHRVQIGYLFQDSDDQLFCPTVIEDVCFGPINQGYRQKEAEIMAYEILRQLGIEELANQVSYLLSGGQKKLVSLATILVMKPKVLLLDEPTNGLDDQNYHLLIDIINRTKLPIILVSHDQKLRQALTDKEYKLSNGKLITSK